MRVVESAEEREEVVRARLHDVECLPTDVINIMVEYSRESYRCIYSTGYAFAAKLRDGGVVTWEC